jgi:hypothetical protein
MRWTDDVHVNSKKATEAKDEERNCDSIIFLLWYFLLP